MSGKIVVNRLNQLQLTYLLTIRGLPVGNVGNMRKSLSRAMRLEKEGSSISYPKYPFTFAEDKMAINEVIAKVEESIADLQSLTLGSNRYVVNDTRLRYALIRLEHLPTTSAEEEAYKGEIFAKVLNLLGCLEEKANVASGLPKKPLNEESSGTEEDDTSSEKDDTCSEKVDEQNLPTSTPRVRATRAVETTSGQVKAIPVYKWGLRFSGEKQGMSVHAFLQRVEELCEARGVTKPEVLKSTVDLLDGKALIWFRAVKDSIVDWNSFVENLRAEFEPFNYDEKLLEEIRKRTQGKDEPIGIYLATIRSLFNRLRSPPTERHQIRTVLRNILPFFQTQLALVSIDSYVELKRLCRQLEERREYVESYAPPPRKSQSCLEPDLAYTSIEEGIEEMQVVERQSPSESKFGKSVMCYNCNQPGHRAIGCAAPKTMRCYKCSQVGYTTRTCPKCNLSGNGPSR